MFDDCRLRSNFYQYFSFSNHNFKS